MNNRNGQSLWYGVAWGVVVRRCVDGRCVTQMTAFSTVAYPRGGMGYVKALLLACCVLRECYGIVELGKVAC